MLHFLSFSFQVIDVLFLGKSFNGYPLGYLEAVCPLSAVRFSLGYWSLDASFEPPGPPKSERFPVIPKIGLKPQGLIGLNRIFPLILKHISPRLIDQTDSLMNVQQNTACFFFNLFQSGFKLFPTIAPQGTEDIAGQASGMDPD